MSKISKLRIFILAILLMVVVSSCTTTATPTNTPTPTATSTAQPTATPSGTVLSALPSVADVVAKVMPAVAYVSVEYKATSFFFQTVATKTGSGVLLSPDGYILTNNHVIDSYTKIEVSLPDDEQTYQARLVGADPTSDLAVIKIDGQNFPTAQFGDPSGWLRDGDWVIALGNALGLVEGGPTVTLGIVSGLGRSFTIGQAAYYDVIQTDAAINPGNSGGPLVDLNGKVVGINTFIISSAENIGFAVSANTARIVYDDLIKYGHVIRPYIGATFDDLTPDLASQLGLSVSKGVLVAYVAPAGPAAKAGIQANDVITLFQGQKVSEASQLIKLLWQYNVGDSVKITYWRGGTEYNVSITLGQRP
jgi:S1-C subfamily serine protease